MIKPKAYIGIDPGLWPHPVSITPKARERIVELLEREGARGVKSISIPVEPIGKPRMTQRDRWKKRECVTRYHSFCDLLRLYVRDQMPGNTNNLSWVAYFPIPKSWSKKKKAMLAGQLHQQKPDRDNVDKAILDALLKEDCAVARGYTEKRWDDGDGPRIVLMWEG